MAKNKKSTLVSNFVYSGYRKELIAALANVLLRKVDLMSDGTLQIEESEPEYQITDGGCAWKREFTIKFIESLQDCDMEEAKENGGKFKTVADQVIEELNKILENLKSK